MRKDKIVFIGLRYENIYIVDLQDESSFKEKYLTSYDENVVIWHRKLGHASLPLLSKLAKHDIFYGLPKINFRKNHICEASSKVNMPNYGTLY